MNKTTVERSGSKFLQDLINRKASINLYLINGIKLQGYLVDFDTYTLFFTSTTESKDNIQLVYKHAVSTIVINSNSHKPNACLASNPTRCANGKPADNR